jgi:hypothetical protein
MVSHFRREEPRHSAYSNPWLQSQQPAIYCQCIQMRVPGPAISPECNPDPWIQGCHKHYHHGLTKATNITTPGVQNVGKYFLRQRAASFTVA